MIIKNDPDFKRLVYKFKNVFPFQYLKAPPRLYGPYTYIKIMLQTNDAHLPIGFYVIRLKHRELN